MFLFASCDSNKGTEEKSCCASMSKDAALCKMDSSKCDSVKKACCSKDASKCTKEAKMCCKKDSATCAAACEKEGKVCTPVDSAKCAEKCKKEGKECKLMKEETSDEAATETEEIEEEIEE